MAISSKRSKRKKTGGRYKSKLTKRSSNLRNHPRHTKLNEVTKSSTRTLGGGKKIFLLNSNVVNVYNPKDRNHKKLKILEIVSNQANRHFVRRNILTRGAIVKTEIGNVKITSRPGQEGAINGVLV